MHNVNSSQKLPFQPKLVRLCYVWLWGMSDVAVVIPAKWFQFKWQKRNWRNQNLSSIFFVECTIKMFKNSFCVYCILRSLWKHLKPSKSKWFSTIMLSLNDAPNHSTWYTSGGRKVEPHNAVPRCIAWCIKYPPWVGILYTCRTGLNWSFIVRIHFCCYPA